LGLLHHAVLEVHLDVVCVANRHERPFKCLESRIGGEAEFWFGQWC
jgi:hypothetical protein